MSDTYEYNTLALINIRIQQSKFGKRALTAVGFGLPIEIYSAAVDSTVGIMVGALSLLIGIGNGIAYNDCVSFGDNIERQITN